MKLHADPGAPYAITQYGSGWVGLADHSYHGSFFLHTQGHHSPWSVACFEDLNASHFEQLAQQVRAWGCEVILFGSGRQCRFVPPLWMKDIVHMGIGLETMDTHAACRTYNILAAEGRVVLGAFVLEPAPA